MYSMWVSLCVCVCVCLCSYKCARAGSQTHMPHSHAVDAARPCSSGSFDSSTTWSMLTVNCLRLLCAVAVAAAQPVCRFVIISKHLQRFDLIDGCNSAVQRRAGCRLQIAAGRWHEQRFATFHCNWLRQQPQFIRIELQPVLSKLFSNAIKIYWFYSNLIIAQASQEGELEGEASVLGIFQ